MQRYWNGQEWTDQVQPAPYAGQQPGYGPGQQLSYGPGQQPGYSPGSGQASGPGTTPDGQRTAGWWQRVGAYVLDAIIIFALSAVLGWSFLHRVVSAYSSFVDQVMRAAQSGSAAPNQSSLMSQIFVPLLGFVAVNLLVSLVYNAVFLKRFAATPGKLALGLRVRLRETPGPLSWGTVLLRWLAQNIAGIFSVVPLIGTLAAIYPMLDSLWPLWDSKKQALHDKVARTNVVRANG